ncbi:ABC transporter permease [Xanthomonas bonasiae]|uniref:ABC transporter permease n=1 Tax=Xanthomonas bonasiae TaxID=2810351 RepID=UPI001981E9E4|nr:ABC transporter permease [Xanthomonas bonasiae]MBN6110001.1 ABC transporter permease [Xanthomonas bonasiae]
MMWLPGAVALSDIASALKKYQLAGLLGWQDVRQRYRRSALGPFWLTVSMAVMIATIGVVFSLILKTPLRDFLPFLSVGLIFWGFISTVVNEGCGAFISSESIIKQLPIPLFVHVMRLIWRNLIIVAHNVVILPLVFFAVGKPITAVALMSIPGLLVIVLNLAWIVLLLGIVCARYRDLPQIIANAVQVAFYLTPIMWMPTLLPKEKAAYLLDLNPLYHLLELVRAPLLGSPASAADWYFSLGLLLAGWLLALAFHNRYKRRIAYWL